MLQIYEELKYWASSPAYFSLIDSDADAETTREESENTPERIIYNMQHLLYRRKLTMLNRNSITQTNRWYPLTMQKINDIDKGSTKEFCKIYTLRPKRKINSRETPKLQLHCVHCTVTIFFTGACKVP